MVTTAMSLTAMIIIMVNNNIYSINDIEDDNDKNEFIFIDKIPLYKNDNPDTTMKVDFKKWCLDKCIMK